MYRLWRYHTVTYVHTVLVLVYIACDHETLPSNRVSLDNWLALMSRSVVLYGRRTGTIPYNIPSDQNPKNQNPKIKIQKNQNPKIKIQKNQKKQK